MFEVFERRESEVRGYCRHFPIMLKDGKNSEMFDASGERYIDFFAGAGALAFGHNNPYIKKKVLEYMNTDGIIQALDLYTPITEQFFKTFEEIILEPRNLDYKIQFCNASGANAVEAALKLARKNKQRSNILACMGSYHGQSLGALAVTSGVHGRGGAGVSLDNVTFVPYATDLETEEKSLEYLRWILSDDHSGITKPAAIILEAVQGEGGIKVPSVEWLQGIRKICDDNDMLMICDEIQAGVGRTGWFFAFERAGIEPDIITVSKSIGGIGLPLSMVLMKPEIDDWSPGEHTGTFRGNQLSLIGATGLLEYYRDNRMDVEVRRKGDLIGSFMDENIKTIDERIQVRGIGMFWGIDFSGIDSALAEKVQEEAVKRHLIADICGRNECVFKILAPITIEDEILLEGLDIISESIKAVLK
ncbi:MAG: diaminobutyrate--2-oxoglutarate transaminase [Bacillota bacterium]|nr:diaminobutyrate--2-oxoglutarate transaminase [Bacillota bacterium]